MTRDDTDGRARRGYLILAGILLAAVLIFNADAVRDIGRKQVELVALLPDAAGVRVGTPVSVSGVQSGRVSGIEFLASSAAQQVALHIVLSGDGVDVVRRDSDVRAVRLRVIGQPVVHIDAGTMAAPPVGSGDTLRAHARVDPRQLLEEGKSLPASLDSLLTSARQVAALAQARQPDLQRLQESVAAVTAAASELSLDLEGGSIGPMMAPGGLDGVERLRVRLGELGDLVAVASERYTGAGLEPSALSTSLTGLRARVTVLQADLDELTGRMESGGGILYRMPRDSALQVAIRGVQAQIDSLRQEAASIALRMILP